VTLFRTTLVPRGSADVSASSQPSAVPGPDRLLGGVKRDVDAGNRGASHGGPAPHATPEFAVGALPGPPRTRGPRERTPRPTSLTPCAACASGCLHPKPRPRRAPYLRPHPVLVPGLRRARRLSPLPGARPSARRYVDVPWA